MQPYIEDKSEIEQANTDWYVGDYFCKWFHATFKLFKLLNVPSKAIRQWYYGNRKTVPPQTINFKSKYRDSWQCAVYPFLVSICTRHTERSKQNFHKSSITSPRWRTRSMRYNPSIPTHSQYKIVITLVANGDWLFHKLPHRHFDRNDDTATQAKQIEKSKLVKIPSAIQGIAVKKATSKIAAYIDGSPLYGLR